MAGSICFPVAVLVGTKRMWGAYRASDNQCSARGLLSADERVGGNTPRTRSLSATMTLRQLMGSRR